MQADRQANGIEPAIAAAYFFIMRATGVLSLYNTLVDGHGAGTSRGQLSLNNALAGAVR
jgi:hypothetical protein